SWCACPTARSFSTRCGPATSRRSRRWAPRSRARSRNPRAMTARNRRRGSRPRCRRSRTPRRVLQPWVRACADTVSLSQLLEPSAVVVNAKPLSTGAPWWQTLLVGFGPTLLFLGLLFLLLRRAGGMQNALSSFGRSRARRYAPSGDRVTFADVAGIEEAKSE